MTKLAIILFILTLLSTTQVFTQSNKETIEVLKKNYGQFYKNSTFLFNYNQIRYNTYQSYDFRNPDRLLAFIKIGLDFDENTFYARRKQFFPGGYLFEFNEFQERKDSFGYDENGILYGKKLFKQNPNRITEIKKEIGRIVDFVAVKSLFDDEGRIEVKSNKESNQIIIEKIIGDKNSVVFTFNKSPIYLISTHSKPSNIVHEFSNYKKLGGLHYAASVTQKRNGQFRATYLINTLQRVKSLNEEFLKTPKGYKLFLDENNSELKVEEIGKNLFLIEKIAGDRNVLFYVKDNEISVFGSPISDDWSKRVINIIKKKFPDKIIKYVYITHFHSDHIGGLNAYIQNRTKVLADGFTIEAIKNHPRFKNVSADNFREFKTNEIVNGVKFYSVENSHAKGQSFAYVADEKIIYEGDFLEIPFDNTIPTYMPRSTKQFIEFVKSNKLDFERVVGHHRNSNISKKIVESYYRKYVNTSSVY